MVMEQEAYTRLMVANLEKDYGGRVKGYATPCMSQAEAEAQSGMGMTGLFRATAASHC